ncbi:MAG: RNA polymerase sigma factor [Verrucomicrobia bacterium]|nr:RNA polymerase sigma factor [Verrucomicrobiota bacterium]
MGVQDSYSGEGPEQSTPDFESLVAQHYGALYRFAVSLTRTQDDACDLVQETFRLWAEKGHQLRDKSKAKTWLFTTLHRLFLETQRRLTRFPHLELDGVADELPNVTPDLVDRLDGAALVELLGQVDAQFQAPVALFYLEDYSYNEIAEILNVPLGTVKSRMARGLAQLKQLVARQATGSPSGENRGGQLGTRSSERTIAAKPRSSQQRDGSSPLLILSRLGNLVAAEVTKLRLHRRQSLFTAAEAAFIALRRHLAHALQAALNRGVTP